MAAYLIVQIRVTADRSAFAAYRDAVGPLSQQFGGRYLIAGGAKIEVLEGARMAEAWSSSSSRQWNGCTPSGTHPPMPR